MELVMMLLAALVASTAVFLTAWLLLKQFFGNEEKKRVLELRIKNQGLLTPVRLQAYERVILYLERISPNGLILRVFQPSLNSFQLQSLLIQTIRSEFEHNLSQQIYLSNAAWELVKNAKEDTIKLVNLAAAKVGDNASGTDLSTAMIELNMQNNVQKNQIAIDFIKNEISKLF
jgi:hypothetical protein